MLKNKKHPIRALIEQGEHVHLDFKFEVSDAPKIARSLVAFANTDGGTLLIGVKDNGAIAGIRSEEEFYMIQQAAGMYCQPEVSFTTKEWSLEGKKVLEVKVPLSQQLPHRAPDVQGKYKVFVRVKDQIVLANGIQIKVWKKQSTEQAVVITYNESIKQLLTLIESHEEISFDQLKTTLGLSKHQLEDVLSDLIVMDVISMQNDENQILFKLAI